ncbi:MAG: hypothetical protein KDK76_04490 [Chlamydiia bacterium]|nr:hypothetical protein [Chlamydiia bacterium]
MEFTGKISPFRSALNESLEPLENRKRNLETEEGSQKKPRLTKGSATVKVFQFDEPLSDNPIIEKATAIAQQSIDRKSPKTNCNPISNLASEKKDGPKAQPSIDASLYLEQLIDQIKTSTNNINKELINQIEEDVRTINFSREYEADFLAVANYNEVNRIFLNLMKIDIAYFIKKTDLKSPEHEESLDLLYKKAMNGVIDQLLLKVAIDNLTSLREAEKNPDKATEVRKRALKLTPIQNPKEFRKEALQELKDFLDLPDFSMFEETRKLANLNKEHFQCTSNIIKGFSIVKMLAS